MNVRVTGRSLNGRLVEAHYFRIFLQLSKLPYFSTLQKFADRINNVMLGKIISSFVVLTGTGRIHIFWYTIDSTGFSITRASKYYAERAKLREGNIPNYQTINRR
ncbi:MAG: hypothetical protein WCF03_04960 [Nitrososphaeraceae archaeon]